MKVSELIIILSKNQCYLVGHGANHDKWQSQISGKTFFVPRHPSKEIKIGTLKQICRLAGIDYRKGE